jgi:hypothetical protein
MNIITENLCSERSKTSKRFKLLVKLYLAGIKDSKRHLITEVFSNNSKAAMTVAIKI